MFSLRISSSMSLFCLTCFTNSSTRPLKRVNPGRLWVRWSIMPSVVPNVAFKLSIPNAIKLLACVWIKYLSQRRAVSEPEVFFVMSNDISFTNAMTYCEGRYFTVSLTVSSSVCRKTFLKIFASRPWSAWINWCVIFFAFGLLLSPTVRLSKRVSSGISTGLWIFLVALTAFNTSRFLSARGVTMLCWSSFFFLTISILMGSFLTRMVFFCSCWFDTSSNFMSISP